MIQISRPEQFTRAAARLNTERQSIRRHEPGLYSVTNIVKGHTYHVRISRQNGLTFGACTCKAGLSHGRRPLVCKHLTAVVIYLRGLQAMRRHAAQVSR